MEFFFVLGSTGTVIEIIILKISLLPDNLSSYFQVRGKYPVKKMGADLSPIFREYFPLGNKERNLYI